MAPAIPLNVTDFDLKNTNGKALLYRTSDSTLNRLTFAIVNGTKADLKLLGGASGTGSTFKIDFSSLLSDSVVEGLTIDLPPGWADHFEPATDYDPPAWWLAPEADVTLKANESVKFEISNIVLDNYNAGNFEIQWSNIPEQRDSISALTIWLGVINPPDPNKEDLNLVLNRFYSNVTQEINNPGRRKSDEVIEEQDGTPVPIYITYDSKALIFNGFTYNLTNTSKEQIPASRAVGAGTVLSISFLVGEQSYDITTPDRAINRMAIVVTSNDPPWKPDAKSSSGGLITFTFKPESDIFLRKRETLSLDIQAIVTALNVDPGTISTMYAQINNVPGYNDAVFFLALEKKVAKAKAVSFDAVPTTINLGENMKLSWETELAKRVTIDYHEKNGNPIMLDSDKGEIPLNGTAFSPPTRPTAQFTLFSLAAYDNSDTPSGKQCWVKVQWPPRIRSFSSDQRLVKLTGETEINLSWEIENNVSKLTLEALGVVYDVTDQSSYSYRIKTSTVFKLQAYGFDPNPPEPAVARTTVFAYKPGPTLGMKFTGVAMQNWPVVLASRVDNSVFALDAGIQKVYRFAASDGKPLALYDGTLMTLSRNEPKLFVCMKEPAQSGNYSAVLMVDLRSGVRSGTILAGPASAMICNGSDTLLCCAMTDYKKIALIRIGARGELGPPTYVSVGATPISMVFSDDSSMLYVANYASNSISLIRLSDGLVTNIILTQSKPNSMVYQKTLKRLFVACEGEDKVAMIELSNNAVTYIKTGALPSRLLLNPSQDTLYVANFVGNTVSVIDAVKGVAKLPPLNVGDGPFGMALNEGCNLLFVCNYCSRTLSVIELPGNQVLPEQLSTGENSGNPFGLAFVEGNDYATVFVGKENFPNRCSKPANTPNTSLSVAAFAFPKPRL